MAARKNTGNTPVFTGRNVALAEIAQTSGISVAAIKQGLREGALNFGYAIPCGEGKLYRCYCPDKPESDPAQPMGSTLPWAGTRAVRLSVSLHCYPHEDPLLAAPSSHLISHCPYDLPLVSSVLMKRFFPDNPFRSPPAIKLQTAPDPVPFSETCRMPSKSYKPHWTGSRSDPDPS